MAELITADDVTPLLDAPMDAAKLAPLVADVQADATRVAPCLVQLEELLADDPARLQQVQAQVRAILRTALLRRATAAAGGQQVTTTTQQVGPWAQTQQVDTSEQQSKGLFWPSEVRALQDICQAVTGGKGARAWNLDTATFGTTFNHQPWCDLAMGGTACSCGAYLTAGEYPLWEGGALS